MRTLRQCLAEAKKRGVYLGRKDCYENSLFLDKRYTTKEFEQWKEKYVKQMLKRYTLYGLSYSVPSDEMLKSIFKQKKDNNNRISIGTDQNSFCCAIITFGNFMWSKRAKILHKHWDLLFQWYVQKSDRKFHTCGVPNTKGWKVINDGLKKAGFTRIAQEKSNMGRYLVNVWQFVKK